MLPVEIGNFYEFSPPFCGENEKYLWLIALRVLRSYRKKGIVTMTLPFQFGQFTEEAIVVPLTEYGVQNGVCIASVSGKLDGAIGAFSGPRVIFGRFLTIDGGELVATMMLESLYKEPLPRGLTDQISDLLANLPDNWCPQVLEIVLKAIGAPVSGNFMPNIIKSGLYYSQKPQVDLLDFY